MPRRTTDAILLVNAALINPEPLAQLVLAISAVEMLGQVEDWSAAQRDLLEKMATSTEDHADISAEERNEVGQSRCSPFCAARLLGMDRRTERGYRGSARLSCAASPPRCRPIRVGELHVHPVTDCLNTKNPRILLCTLYVGVLEAEEIDRSWSTYTLS